MSSSSDPKPMADGYPVVAPPTGVAYAYPAPPPHAAPYYHPPPYYPGPAYPARNYTLLLRRFTVVVVSALILIFAVSLMVRLLLRPQIPQFVVTSAAISAFNLSSSQLTSDFDLTLTVRNPNRKMSVYYERISASVLYGGGTIAEASLPPFYQGKGNTTDIRARMAAISEYLDSDLVRGISNDRSGGGDVRFQVRVFGWAVFRGGMWRTRRHAIRVYCDDVRVGFKNATADAGSLVGPTKRCEVDI